MQFVAPYHVVNVDLAAHLHADHLRDLRASGLHDEIIRAAGVYSIAPRDMVHFFSRGVPAKIETATCFPYQGGEFARIKLFPSLGKMKYAQPPGTSARLYMPFTITNAAIYVCEGEKKALAAYQAGFNAVGIGGLWNFLSNGEPIDDLNLIRWDDREVTIIPDSDIFQRADLMRAVYALGCELRGRGASVCVAQIPQASDVKVGLDDFIVGGGKVDGLEVFSLGHRIFKSIEYWHGRWKFKKALEAA